MTDKVKKLITVFLEAPDAREKILNRLSELMELVINDRNWVDPPGHNPITQETVYWLWHCMPGNPGPPAHVGEPMISLAWNGIDIACPLNKWLRLKWHATDLLLRDRFGGELHDPGMPPEEKIPSCAASELYKFATLLNLLEDRPNLRLFVLEAGEKATLYTARILGREVVETLLTAGILLDPPEVS